ncbi:MAG: transcription-repair coupling factor, partial [Endozoicomonadaceae bacterium]|nr:transcription-repair coupling factor [Endozoicomonadaceae bacterium]
KVLFVSESTGRKEHLMQTLAQHHIKPTVFSDWHAFYHQDEIAVGIVVAPIEKGLWWTDEHLAILTESDLFGTPILTRRRLNKQNKHFKADDMIRHLTELEQGALVVHLKHGIGRYDGLKTLTIDRQQQEFLKLLYAGQDTLYVPVSDLELIARYSGAESEQVILNKLGSQQWNKARQKAAEKIKDTAVELLDIYARREACSGEAITYCEATYQKFTHTFPFEVTLDQKKAIHDVLSDLKRKQPMDRIICGDVGFGKTEVAMCAAFVMCQAGKQVAILTPTTLLAQQHYDNFMDRFSIWPIHIEVLSRFKRPKEIEIIKQNLKSGVIDIIIGTHKLLNQDIAFKDLGLLVIDEEHRFGVNQKERMKSMRSQVNILILTATPIPRTLNMAMSNIRDLSIIATPPDKRLAIKTFLKIENDHIIREALLRELLRGGQVYFLHNEVSKIEETAQKIQRLVPEVRVAVAHGQMRERDLEHVMKNFYHKKSNVLVCTTIIETGIDIPHANTIIIQNANRFGLAQLHQLRGRVGRSNHQAYAYLLLSEETKITKNAEKRLHFISKTTQLGAGFMLATHDLEIRGAGELLGENQTGQIAAIGFSLYMDLLNQTVDNLKKGKALTDISMTKSVEVNLKASVLIPEKYITSPHERLVIYKRIASCQTKADLSDLQCEIIDRFGVLPRQAHLLLEVANMKLEAHQIGIQKIIATDEQLSLYFLEKNALDATQFILWIQKQAKEYQFMPPNRLNYTVPMMDVSEKMKAIWLILEALVSFMPTT